VAAIKTLELVQLLLQVAEVRLVTTNAAKHFFFESSRSLLPSDVKVYTDEDEWYSWKKKEDPVVHIEVSASDDCKLSICFSFTRSLSLSRLLKLRKWADILLIAPLSANTLAKLANGLSDNLLVQFETFWHKQQ
jgi:phosphopantothenoylcysteine decarboxylase